MNGQWYVEDSGKYCPTCVAASADPKDTSNCETLVCGAWAGSIKTQASRIEVALKRNDFKHESCPTIQTKCQTLPNHMWDAVKNAMELLYDCTEVSNADMLDNLKHNICYGEDHVLRYVDKEQGQINT